MSIEQNKTVSRRLIEEVFNQRNIAAADELISDSFIEHEELPPGLPAGVEGFKQIIQMMHSAFPDFNAAIHDIIAEGDKVAVRMTWSGTQNGEFMEIPASGNSFSTPVFDIFRIVDGKIEEHWGLSDMAGMMQQLGAAPGPE